MSLKTFNGQWTVPILLYTISLEPANLEVPAHAHPKYLYPSNPDFPSLVFHHQNPMPGTSTLCLLLPPLHISTAINHKPYLTCSLVVETTDIPTVPTSYSVILSTLIFPLPLRLSSLSPSSIYSHPRHYISTSPHYHFLSHPNPPPHYNRSCRGSLLFPRTRKVENVTRCPL